jgi:hypothetical protein
MAFPFDAVEGLPPGFAVSLLADGMTYYSCPDF